MLAVVQLSVCEHTLNSNSCAGSFVAEMVKGGTLHIATLKLDRNSPNGDIYLHSAYGVHRLPGSVEVCVVYQFLLCPSVGAALLVQLATRVPSVSPF